MREPHAPDHAPRDWNEAFAALPPETPAADALAQVFARIPASTPARPGRQWWIATAAALALVAVVPLAMNVAPHPGASRSPAAALAGNASTLDPGLRRDDGKGTVTVRPDVTTPPVVAPPTHSTPIRVVKADVPHRKPRHAHRPVLKSEPSDKLMEPLYAESARLEALLALARDDRAASATAVALGSDFEARVAGIDATLAQPSLTRQHRLELWKDRVSALRAYASFESTQRALAASGERYDAMLVSID